MKYDKPKNTKSTNSNEILHFVGVCFLSSSIATAAVMLGGSAAALQFARPYGCFVITSYLVLALNSLILSWLITSHRRKQWLYNGILTGLCVFLCISGISAMFNMFAFGFHLVPRAITCVLSGLIGSYAALYKRKRKRG